MINLKLFIVFLQVGLFSFGGGYASLPLIQEQIVTRHGWISASEFTDLISISQLTPGSIALNASTFVGTRMSGLPGALCATAGCMLPSTLIVLLLVWIYRKYHQAPVIDGIMSVIRPVTVGLVFSAGISIMLPAFAGIGTGAIHADFIAIILSAAGVFLLRKTRISALWLMLLSGGVGLAAYLLSDRLTAA